MDHNYYTIVWEKFMVGNIHEKFHGKKILATDHYKLLYLFMVRKFVFNFRRTWLLMKIFHAEFFPNYSICNGS